MGADSFIKSQMHRMPTYEEVLNDTLHSTDRINLPDRRATQLRSSHQLTRFDEVDETPDLADEQVKITKEKLTRLAFESLGGDETRSEAMAKAPRPDYEKMTEQGGEGKPPPPQPPAAVAQKQGLLSRLAGRFLNYSPGVPGQGGGSSGSNDTWIDPSHTAFDDAQVLREEQERERNLLRITRMQNVKKAKASEASRQASEALSDRGIPAGMFGWFSDPSKPKAYDIGSPPPSQASYHKPPIVQRFEQELATSEAKSEAKSEVKSEAKSSVKRARSEHSSSHGGYGLPNARWIEPASSHGSRKGQSEKSSAHSPNYEVDDRTPSRTASVQKSSRSSAHSPKYEVDDRTPPGSNSFKFRSTG